MQDALAAKATGSEIVIMGVNQLNHHMDNDLMCDGRDLAYLQDTTDDDVWGAWDVAYRDVVILDEDNVRVAAFNLSTYDLNNQAHYDSLMTLLEETAAD